jgi:hypothetical protein
MAIEKIGDLIGIQTVVRSGIVAGETANILASSQQDDQSLAARSENVLIVMSLENRDTGIKKRSCRNSVTPLFYYW